MEQKRNWSLATIVSLHCTWIVAAFMAVYGGFEVWIFGESALFAALKHSSHVILIFAGLVLILKLVLQYRVTRPIRQINAQLYRLGAGAMDFRPVETNVRELVQIVEGIGLMRKRMHVGEAGAALLRAEAVVRDLRAVAKELHAGRPEESRRILDATVRLGETFGGIFC